MSARVGLIGRRSNDPELQSLRRRRLEHEVLVTCDRLERCVRDGDRNLRVIVALSTARVLLHEGDLTGAVGHARIGARLAKIAPFSDQSTEPPSTQ
jgi:hypothetical protein